MSVSAAERYWTQNQARQGHLRGTADLQVLPGLEERSFAKTPQIGQVRALHLLSKDEYSLHWCHNQAVDAFCLNRVSVTVPRSVTIPLHYTRVNGNTLF